MAEWERAARPAFDVIKTNGFFPRARVSLRFASCSHTMKLGNGFYLDRFTKLFLSPRSQLDEICVGRLFFFCSQFLKSFVSFKMALARLEEDMHRFVFLRSAKGWIRHKRSRTFDEMERARLSGSASMRHLEHGRRLAADRGEMSKRL